CEVAGRVGTYGMLEAHRNHLLPRRVRPADGVEQGGLALGADAKNHSLTLHIDRESCRFTRRQETKRFYDLRLEIDEASSVGQHAVRRPPHSEIVRCREPLWMVEGYVANLTAYCEGDGDVVVQRCLVVDLADVAMEL